jgi:hypothetical protein
MKRIDERIRRLLAQRLGAIGVSPDARNDAPAVRAIAQQLGVPMNLVVDLLVDLRREQCDAMSRRMGLREINPGGLTMLAAMRDSLLKGISYDEAFALRAQQGLTEVARGVGPSLLRQRPVAV